MNKLSTEEVLKLARLSRLKLSNAEVAKLQIELAEILDYVKTFDKVDTKGLEPTYQVSGLTNVYRPDEIREYQAKPADLLANAPTQDGQYKVKRVL